MKRNGKRFLVPADHRQPEFRIRSASALCSRGFSGDGAAFVSRDRKNRATDLSVNRPDPDVPEVSYEPIIIGDIPDGPIPAGETWDNEVSATDIAENDIQRLTASKVHLSDGSSKLWISVGLSPVQA